LNEGLIKQLVGNSPISVRHLHKAPIQFVPRFKMIFECNSLPDIVGRDDGIWRRIRVVPWTVQIPPSEVDLDIEEKLMGEAPGVLNWLLAGLREYRERGLAEPQAVLDATAKYRGAPDAVVAWFRERVTRDPMAECDQLALWEDFQSWCRSAGKWAHCDLGFSSAMIALGAKPAGKHSRTRRVRLRGVRLTFDTASQSIR
jgi:putative DNA primase/helicase